MNTANTGDYTCTFTTRLPAKFGLPTDAVGKRLLKEYGSLFVARGVALPTTVVFNDHAAVEAFKSAAAYASETIGGIKIVLQEPAMRGLNSAIAEAATAGLTITPRGPAAARRSYDETVELWRSRVEPGLAYWTSAGRVSVAEAERIRALSPFDQVAEIFRLEEQGIFFSKDLSKPIIYSVAPPGASQHLSMLALDVAQFDDAQVRAVLAKHGWFQTVISDLPHFTYLGAGEGELPGLGLKKVVSAERVFWVPDL